MKLNDNKNIIIKYIENIYYRDIHIIYVIHRT